MAEIMTEKGLVVGMIPDQETPVEEKQTPEKPKRKPKANG